MEENLALNNTLLCHDKSFLISKIKYIVEKYGNIFLDGLTGYDLPIYQQNSDERHSVSELTDNFVNIIAYDGVSEYTPPENTILIKVSDELHIGDIME